MKYKTDTERNTIQAWKKNTLQTRKEIQYRNGQKNNTDTERVQTWTDVKNRHRNIYHTKEKKYTLERCTIQAQKDAQYRQ